MASVDIGNDQPDISYINSMDQTVDFLQIKRGNPHLDNTKLYVVGIAYKAQLNRLNFQILGVYQKIQNNISTDYYLENDKLVSSFRSDMDVEHWNAALDLSYRFSDNLRAKFNARYYHTIIPGEYNITDNSVSIIGHKLLLEKSCNKCIWKYSDKPYKPFLSCDRKKSRHLWNFHQLESQRLARRNRYRKPVHQA